MKRIFLSAAVGAAAVTGAAYADMGDVRSNYNSEAFSEIDDDWRRITTNRFGTCGTIGSSDTRRIDVLIDQYLEIGAALNAGNQSGAEEAARTLAATIDRNSRFEDCWRQISRRQSVSRSFTKAITKL